MALIYQPSKRIFCGWFEPLKSTTYSEYPPYTKLLMASTPGADAHVVRYYPKGAMPSPIDRPKGCVFASRCPLAEARCRTDVPPLRDDGSGHLAACFSGPSFLLHPEA